MTGLERNQVVTVQTVLMQTIVGRLKVFDIATLAALRNFYCCFFHLMYSKDSGLSLHGH